ncbi:MAG: hypothetical protein H6707_10450 [Deltaproteobacteria bacterium]|nr:hypothetical protein [Deltaproteobacteria bacterium]
MRRFVYTAALLAISLVIGCSMIVGKKLDDKASQSDGGTTSDAATIDDASSPDGDANLPTVSISADPPGFFDNEPINIEVKVTNFNLVPPAQPLPFSSPPGEGFYRIYLDTPGSNLLAEGAALNLQIPSSRLVQLDGGKYDHDLVIELVDSSGRQLSPPVESRFAVHRCGNADDHLWSTCGGPTGCRPQDGCDPWQGMPATDVPACATATCSASRCVRIDNLGVADAPPGATLAIGLKVKIPSTTNQPKLRVILFGPLDATASNQRETLLHEAFVTTFEGPVSISPILPTHMQNGPYLLNAEIQDGNAAKIVEHCWPFFVVTQP